jgi:hypothetical protein
MEAQAFAVGAWQPTPKKQSGIIARAVEMTEACI